MSLPPEMINYIFSYSQGATNQIIKSHIENKNSVSDEIEFLGLMKLNKEYNFKHYNHDRFMFAYFEYCSLCGQYLNVYEYLHPVYAYQDIICYCFIDSIYPDNNPH